MRFIGIDPSTKTGFVALDANGEVLKEKELKGIGSADPKRMVTLVDEIIAHLKPDDFICIEGFSFNSTGQGVDFQYGLGWNIRNSLFRRGFNYIEVAPNAVKKYVNVTGWVGEPGNKRRLKGPEKKKAVMAAVKEHFGYQHSSDNVVDAYILAKIASGCFLASETGSLSSVYTSYQAEVIEQILNPAEKKARKKA